MRDIRDDLRERLRDADGRKAERQIAYERDRATLDAEFQADIALIDREADLLRSLLIVESERLGERITTAAPETSLADYLMTIIRQNGPTYKDELRYHAEKAGYFANGSNGRAVHTTLLNLVHHGRLIKIGGDRFGVPSLPLLDKQAGATDFDPRRGDPN